MKKLILLLTVLLCFTGCGSSSSSTADAQANPEIVEFFEKYDDTQSLGDDVGYIYIFDDGTEYGLALSVVFNEEQAAEYDALEWSDTYFDEIQKIVEKSETYTLTNLNEDIPSQDVLDQYIGSTIGELMNKGFMVWGTDLQENLTRITLEDDKYDIEVTANEVLPIEEDIPEEDLEALTVKSVVFNGYSDDYFYSLIAEK